jgi:hypothetical protein
MTYGTALSRRQRMANSPRSVIGTLDTSPAGNLILAVGHTIDEDGHWEKTEHVVMARDEAMQFVGHVLAILGLPAHAVAMPASREENR